LPGFSLRSGVTVPNSRAADSRCVTVRPSCPKTMIASNSVAPEGRGPDCDSSTDQPMRLRARILE
jgi:hypothetical protein